MSWDNIKLAICNNRKRHKICGGKKSKMSALGNDDYADFYLSCSWKTENSLDHKKGQKSLHTAGQL